MSDEYVRKDTLEEVMKRIEVMMAASEARQNAQIAEIRGEVKELRAVIDGYSETAAAYIDSTDKRINDIQSTLNAFISRQAGTITRWGIVIAVMIAAVQIAINFLVR